jgi:WD40 repeat protein
LWTPSGELRATLAGHAASDSDVSCSPDVPTLATAGASHPLKLLASGSGELRATLAGHTDVVYRVTFEPDHII